MKEVFNYFVVVVMIVLQLLLFSLVFKLEEDVRRVSSTIPLLEEQCQEESMSYGTIK